METKQITIPTAPEPEPQKPSKKTAVLARISFWTAFSWFALLCLVLKSQTDFKWDLIGVAIIIAEAIAFLTGIAGIFQILFSKSRLKGYVYCVGGIFIPLFILTVAAPNFLRFGARSKQSEAKQNLRAIFTAYHAYHNNYHTFPSSPSIQVGNTVFNCLSIAGWEPKGQIRYNYNCMNTEVFSPSLYYYHQNNRYPCPPGIVTNTKKDRFAIAAECHRSPCPPGIVTNVTKDGFTIAACGNVDNDTTVDVWTIDDAKHLKNVINDLRK
jgi:hypothetical protein